jgi:hypothetical protein
LLLGFGVRPIGDEHLAVVLGPQRLRVATGAMPQANFLTPAAIISRFSARISAIIASVTKDGSKSSGM